MQTRYSYNRWRQGLPPRGPSKKPTAFHYPDGDDPVRVAMYGTPENNTTFPTAHAPERVTMGNTQSPEAVLYSKGVATPSPKPAAPTREQIDQQIDALVKGSK